MELARGTINRLRNQIGAWDVTGHDDARSGAAPLAAAREHLSWAATRRRRCRGRRKPAAKSTLPRSTAINAWNEAYVSYALSVRHQQAGKLATLLGFNLGGAGAGRRAGQANHAGIQHRRRADGWRDIEAHEGKPEWTVSDQQVEWCRAEG